jgi:nitrate reductase assembly molybdenum cofactor insertion protein NarJ
VRVFGTKMGHVTNFSAGEIFGRMGDGAKDLEAGEPVRQLSALGALGGLAKQDRLEPRAKNDTVDREPKLAEIKRPRPPPVSSASSADMLRSWSSIGDMSKDEEDARGRSATIKSSVKGGGRGAGTLSFGQNEERILSPSGRMVPTHVKKLQGRIVAAMQDQHTTLVETFHSLNRASRERGQASCDAVVTGLLQLLALERSEAAETSETLLSLVREHDANTDGRMTFGEFVTMCGGASARRALRRGAGIDGVELAAEVAEALAGTFQTAQQVFMALDGDRSNKISHKELMRGCDKAGLQLSEEEAAALFQRIDADKSGELTRDEVGELMEHGADAFKASRARAEEEALRAKQIAECSKSIQEALADPAAMERVIDAVQGAATNSGLKIDANAILQLIPPPGVVVGRDDVTSPETLRAALMGPGALSAEEAAAVMTLAPKAIIAHGNVVVTNEGETGKKVFALDARAPAEAGKLQGCPIILQQGTRSDERVIAAYTAERQVTVDMPLAWQPHMMTQYQVCDPSKVCIVEMLLKTQAVLQVRKALAQVEDERKEAARKSAAIANEDLAQCVRGLRSVGANSIKAAWDVFNPQRRPSLTLTELATGIERLGLLLHTPSAYVAKDIVLAATATSPSLSSAPGEKGRRQAQAETRVYTEIFQRQGSVVVGTASGAGAQGIK